VELVEMEQAEVCCGFGGTFAVKFADISGAMLQDKMANILKTRAEAVVACDMSCLMHLAGGMDKQGTPTRALHIAQILDEALSPD
jgi:L-lactate dehydrogenase complex protein LldE